LDSTGKQINSKTNAYIFKEKNYKKNNQQKSIRLNEFYNDSSHKKEVVSDNERMDYHLNTHKYEKSKYNENKNHCKIINNPINKRNKFDKDANRNTTENKLQSESRSNFNNTSKSKFDNSFRELQYPDYIVNEKKNKRNPYTNPLINRKDIQLISNTDDTLSEKSIKNEESNRENHTYQVNLYSNKYSILSNDQSNIGYKKLEEKRDYNKYSSNSHREDENFNIKNYKLKNLGNKANKIEKNNLKSDDIHEKLYEENRKLLNENEDLNLKNRDLELNIKNFEEKYKTLENEIESSNEKINDIENHYLKVIKTKEDIIYNLNKKFSKFEKEEIQSINLKNNLLRYLQQFFLDYLQYLKISEELTKE